MTTQQLRFDPADDAPMPHLQSYDIILVSTSGGKDSQVMLSVVCELADVAGVRDRVVAVHCDLGRLEWSGCPELAAEQCAHFGVPLHIMRRPQGDILANVREKHATNLRKGKQQCPWPGYATRYCTKGHKTAQVWRLMTQLSREVRERVGKRPVRILDCWGNRAEESKRRAKQAPLEYNQEASNKKPADWARVNGVRYVDTWLPIHAWSTEQVWARIEAEGVPHHWAYDAGMPRLSCCFCFFALQSRKSKPLPAEEQLLWLIAGYHNRPLLREYVAVEQETGYTYVQGFSMADLEQVLEQGWQPPTGRINATWRD
jgi:3'-phosphoadenosine 5'-phosphosulfate sulfotransferase (PAPS reductase)/FAD synthetase